MKKVLMMALPLMLLGNAYAQEKSETTEEEKHECVCPSTGKSILYMSPIKFTDNGVGFEFGYERRIDEGGIVAYNLPLVATFNLAHDNLSLGNKQDPMFYFMPGIKFYPTSSFGKVKYAIGPSLLLGVGTETRDYYDYPYYSTMPYAPGYKTRDKFQLGVLINNSMNINPSSHFTMGLDFGFGFTYVTKLDGQTQNMRGLVQGGFKMGYRL